MREIEAALPLVSPVAAEWGLVQDRVIETQAKMADIENLIKMTGKLDMDNDLDSLNSLELTHSIPSQEVGFRCVTIVLYNFFKVIMKSRLINKRVTLNVGGVR